MVHEPVPAVNLFLAKALQYPGTALDGTGPMGYNGCKQRSACKREQDGENMDIQDLTYFTVICRHQSVAKAARALYITPQGLRKIVRNLEAELGVALLDHGGGGFSLTEAGTLLSQRLPDFLHEYRHLCNDLRCVAQRETHEIHLLSAYGILRLVTPDCLTAFARQYPHIQLRYREFPDRQVEQRFLDGEGDVAFTVGNHALKHVDALQMEKFEIKLMVHRDHPLSRKTAADIRDLAAAPLYIESAEFNIHHDMLRRCAAAGVHPQIAFESSGFSLCQKMVAQNKGISVIVDFISDDMRDSRVVLLPFSDGPYYWETYLLTRRGERPNPDVAVFRDFVMDWMGKIKRGEIVR